jgi:PAS domain-containing protein
MPRKQKLADVTIEKLAAELLGRNGAYHIMAAFMAIAEMPALIMDRNGRLLYMNRPAEKAWKVKIKTVMGQPFSRVMGLSETETDAMNRQQIGVLAGREPRIFLEHFGPNSATRQSVLKIPFTDSDEEVLLGAFILPHEPYPDPPAETA